MMFPREPSRDANEVHKAANTRLYGAADVVSRTSAVDQFLANRIEILEQFKSAPAVVGLGALTGMHMAVTTPTSQKVSATRNATPAVASKPAPKRFDR